MKSKIECVNGGNMVFQPIPANELDNFSPLINCPACGGNDREIVSALGGKSIEAALKLLVCKTCGHIHYSKLPNEEWHDAFYKKNWDLGERANPEGKLKQSAYPGSFWSYFFALDLPKDAKILDFGCGFGKRMLELKEMGYTNLWGVELGEHRVKVAEKFFPGKTLLGSDKEAIELAKVGKFDLIYSTHVFEHIPDPVPTLKRLKEALKPGGLNLIVVPNILGESPLVTNMYISHPNLFNQVSLSSAFRQAGYKPLNWKPAALDFELAVVGAVDGNWEPKANKHLFNIPETKIDSTLLNHLISFVREPFEKLEAGSKVGLSFFQPPFIGRFPKGYSRKKYGWIGGLYVQTKTNPFWNKLGKIPILNMLPRALGYFGRNFERTGSDWGPNFFIVKFMADQPDVWIVSGETDVPLLIK